MTLTQKEKSLIKDLVSQEKLCVDKYNKYSSEACDSGLKKLFSDISQVESVHLNTLNEIGSGKVPQMNSSAKKPTAPKTAANYKTADRNKDQFLCHDALSSEKYVSSAYNTSIFEFTNMDVRNALNHIQKEEQEHGEQIYNFMAQNGMYKTK